MVFIIFLKKRIRNLPKATANIASTCNLNNAAPLTRMETSRRVMQPKSEISGDAFIATTYANQLINLANIVIYKQ